MDNCILNNGEPFKRKFTIGMRVVNALSLVPLCSQYLLISRNSNRDIIFLLCLILLSDPSDSGLIPLGQQRNEQIACARCSPFSFEGNNAAVECDAQLRIARAHTRRGADEHTRAHKRGGSVWGIERDTQREERERQRETEREKDALNRIISSQIINGIILGCSLGNSGQLDARGNNERRREEKPDRDKGNHVRRRRNEKIQKRGGSVGGGEESISVSI